MASRPDTSTYDNKNGITYHCHRDLVGRDNFKYGKFLSTFLSISWDSEKKSHDHLQFIEPGLSWFVGCVVDREY
jgi:hypothetical protein